MFIGFNIFPSAYESQSDSYTDIDDSEGNVTAGEELFKTLSDADFGEIMLLFFANTESILTIITTSAIAIAAAWLTRSPAPFVVGMIGGVMLTLYNNSIDLFAQFPVNGFITLACSIGVFIVFIITCAETLAPGGNT